MAKVIIDDKADWKIYRPHGVGVCCIFRTLLQYPWVLVLPFVKTIILISVICRCLSNKTVTTVAHISVCLLVSYSWSPRWTRYNLHTYDIKSLIPLIDSYDNTLWNLAGRPSKHPSAHRSRASCQEAAWLLKYSHQPLHFHFLHFHFKLFSSPFANFAA